MSRRPEPALGGPSRSASSSQQRSGVARCAGIGLRAPHQAELLASRPALAFLEVHSENFFADGGAALAGLHRAREAYPISLHGVGLGLGSAAGIDPWHLARLKTLVDRIEPAFVSDHACFARAPQADGALVHANDLLPIAFTAAALDILADNVERVQERLGRPIGVENLAAYLDFDDAAGALAEPDFLARLCRRTGCSLLLDLNNVMVNAINRDRPGALAQSLDFVSALPVGIVGEIHLAGHRDVPDGASGLAIDDHGSRVRPDVWTLYEHALRRFGAVPTLIEWDTDLPALGVLLDEAAGAERRARRIAESGRRG